MCVNEIGQNKFDFIWKKIERKKNGSNYIKKYQMQSLSQYLLKHILYEEF